MKNVFIKLLKIFIFVLTKIVPRNRNIWVFGSWFGARYADNSRYFFEYVLQNMKVNNGLEKVVWVTKSDDVYNELKKRGVPVYYFWSIRAVYYHLRAKVFLYDQSEKDVNYLLSAGALHVNLWHGFPLKKIGYFCEGKEKPSRILKFFRKLFSLIDDNKLLATSHFSSNILSEAFAIDKKDVFIAGYPRNYYISGVLNAVPISLEKELLDRLKISQKKIIFYLPTFRDNVPLKFFGESNEGKILNVARELFDRGYQLITKIHCAEKVFHNNVFLHGITNLPVDCDVYPFLKETDILVTDYSSVYFDFLYLDREIIFFPYDLEYYKEEDRGLIFDYDEFTPGAKIFNLIELLPVIDSVEKGVINFSKEREILKQKIFNDVGIDLLMKKLIERI